jgi:DNA polymerase-1
VQSPQALETLVKLLWAQTDPWAPVALDTETTSLNPFHAELVGLGLAWGSGPAELAYIPIAHQGAPATDLLSDAAKAPQQLPLDQVLGALAPWLSSRTHPKTLQNAKYDRLILMRHGLVLEGVVMDTLLADYLRDAGDKHGLEALAQRNFHFNPTSYSDLVPKGASFASVPLEQAADYCGMDVHLTWRLTGLLRQQLADLGPALLPLLEQVELPLETVLATMEATGIRIDIPYLQELGQELGTSLAQLERDAHGAAGGEFNLASPKQLG